MYRPSMETAGVAFNSYKGNKRMLKFTLLVVVYLHSGGTHILESEYVAGVNLTFEQCDKKREDIYKRGDSPNHFTATYCVPQREISGL